MHALLETEQSIMTDATSLANNLERVISRLIAAAGEEQRCVLILPSWNLSTIQS
jgi:hypothetical protein